jgi:hypothetical protein
MPRVITRRRETWKVDKVVVAPNIFGETWYVDGTNGSDSNTGKDPQDAFATLDEARGDSAAGDTICIAPGTYTQTAADQPLTPKAQQIWRAAVPCYGGIPSVIITGTAEATVVDIEVSGVVFMDIMFQADNAAVTQLIDVAETATVTGLTFKDCMFDANGMATVVGINADDGTFILTGLVVDGCRFADCNTGINIGVLGMAYSRIVNSVFDMIDAGGGDVGIALADTSGAATGYGYWISDNLFIGPPDAGKDAVAITVAGTEDTTAIGGITKNMMSYVAVAGVTIDKVGFSSIQNYTGDATGGLLMDVGS